jgi:hypothetical protein
VKREVSRNSTGKGENSITLSLYAAVQFVEGKTRYSAFPLRSLSKDLNMSVTHALSTSYSIMQKRRTAPLCCPVFQRENDINIIPLQQRNTFKRTTFSLEEYYLLGYNAV